MLDGIQGHLPFQEAGTEGELIGVAVLDKGWSALLAGNYNSPLANSLLPKKLDRCPVRSLCSFCMPLMLWDGDSDLQ